MTSVRILVADDHEVVRRGVRGLLEAHAGWQVCEEAVDGREAVEKARKSSPDVAILDIGMPGLNGLDLQEHLLQKGYCVPIIFVTAFPDGRTRERALRAGAVAYLGKPFEESSLISAVGSALKAS